MFFLLIYPRCSVLIFHNFPRLFLFPISGQKCIIAMFLKYQKNYHLCSCCKIITIYCPVIKSTLWHRVDSSIFYFPSEAFASEENKNYESQRGVIKDFRTGQYVVLFNAPSKMTKKSANQMLVQNGFLGARDRPKSFFSS